MNHAINTDSWKASIDHWARKTPLIMSVADDILECCVNRTYMKSSNPEHLDLGHGEYLLDAFARVAWQCLKSEGEFKHAIEMISNDQLIYSCDLTSINDYLADLGAKNYFVYPIKNSSTGAYLASASVALCHPDVRVFNAILDSSMVTPDRLVDWAQEAGLSPAMVFRATPEDFVKSVAMNTEINTISPGIAKIKTTCVLGMDEQTFRNKYMPFKGEAPTQRAKEAAFKPRKRAI